MSTPRLAEGPLQGAELRGPVRHGGQTGGRGGVPRQVDAIDGDRRADVLQEAVVELDARIRDLVPHLFENGPGDADPGGLGQRLYSRGHIDGVAVNVSLPLDDVAQMNTDPQFNDRGAGRLIAFEQPTLDGDRALRRVEGAVEVDHEAVAERLHLAPVMALEYRPQEPLVFLHRSKRQPLILLSQGREADHVREHDRRQSAPALGHHPESGFALLMPSGRRAVGPGLGPSDDGQMSTISEGRVRGARREVDPSRVDLSSNHALYSSPRIRTRGDPNPFLTDRKGTTCDRKRGCKSLDEWGSRRCVGGEGFGPRPHPPLWRWGLRGNSGVLDAERRRHLPTPGPRQTPDALREDLQDAHPVFRGRDRRRDRHHAGGQRPLSVLHPAHRFPGRPRARRKEPRDQGLACGRGDSREEVPRGEV